MEVNISKIFVRLIANLFAGSVFIFVGMWLLLLQFGFDLPRYSLVILLIAGIAGISLSEIISQKYKQELYLINIVVFLIMSAALTFIMGIEDWQFAGMIGLVSILYATLPATIVTGVVYWRNVLKKN